MQEFLHELAEKIYKEHSALEKVTVVFPNRRAILYFRKHLTSLLKQPAFAPELLTIEEFIAQFSEHKIPDKLLLIKRLFRAYTACIPHSGVAGQDRMHSFSDFFFWGEMLLRDFEEIDKYMVEASQLFVDLSNQKEIETIFEFLSEEQVAFLKEFWGNFEEHPSAKKEQFLRIWRSLESVYITFKKLLREEGLAYMGMQHREIAEALMRGADLKHLERYQQRSLIFAGFNALTLAEEKVLSYFVEKNNATVSWDADAYYVNNNTQEAGNFFREYRKHAVLGATFPDQLSASFQEKITNQTPIQVVGAAQPIGQVKVLAQILEEQLHKGWKPEETLIVLPDEKLLLPVLHSIPSSVGKLNVTMGFPLASSPLYNFVELLFELQTSMAQEGLYHRPVLSLLQHPYVIAITKDQTNALRKHILSQNWVHVPTSYFDESSEFLQRIFKVVQPRELLSYFQQCVEQIGESSAIDNLDKEYAFHFYTFINRLQDVVSDELNEVEGNRKQQIKSFQRLFQQLVRAEKIPFAGEPLQGLQIMGVLETRNLDYKNVLMLSLNEGALPAGGNKGSYIPYNLRKAYGLPTSQHQDAMYAYLFYRVLQRAESIHLFYKTETDSLGQGEMSRYLQQLIFESGANVREQVVHNTIQPQVIQSIVIPKNADILESLAKISKGRGRAKGISPSALNTYLECRLKFYFRYVANIREVEEIEEDLDNRVVGVFLHNVIERFYKGLQARKQSALIEARDLENYDDTLNRIIDAVFKEAYGLAEQKAVIYKGQRLVVREIVKRFAERIIELDMKYAPFELEALEREGLTVEVPIEHAPYLVTVTGVVDRADRKGNVLRVVDYKTGKDELNFSTLESLFDREGKRNKAAFQTLLYALLFKQELKNPEETKLVPGLINRRNLFDSSFEFGLRMGKDRVENALPLLPEFQDLLKKMLEELYNPEEVFDQTKEPATCEYCEFKSICYRG